MSKYFFRPRIGKYYQDGYQGLKTLVLGAYPYCWHQSCPHWQQCVAEERPYDYETLCPSYAEKADRAYYRLSNSNTIEIDAYIEGEHYPAYDAFTHRMLGKKTPLGPQSRAFFGIGLPFTTGSSTTFPDRRRLSDMMSGRRRWKKTPRHGTNS